MSEIVDFDLLGIAARWERAARKQEERAFQAERLNYPGLAGQFRMLARTNRRLALRMREQAIRCEKVST